MQDRKNYHVTIETLFFLIGKANLADSSVKEDWQESTDASSQSYFGHLGNAIVSIAGQEIFDHWCETSEIDFDLANRSGIGVNTIMSLLSDTQE
jgi:hypothetical protein